MQTQFLNFISLITNNLRQVTSNISAYKENDLNQLDVAINEYFLKRMAQKQQNQGLMTSISELSIQNDKLQRDLQYITRQFEIEKQRIVEVNRKQSIQMEQWIQCSPYQNFCKQLILQISLHKDITGQLKQLDNIRSMVAQRKQQSAFSVDFFRRVEEIIQGDQIQKEEQSTQLIELN